MRTIPAAENRGVGKTLDNRRTTKTLRNKHKGNGSRALVAESGKKGRVRGSEADLAQCGALALPPPFLFLWLLVQIYFNVPLLNPSFATFNKERQKSLQICETTSLFQHGVVNQTFRVSMLPVHKIQ